MKTMNKLIELYGQTEAEVIIQRYKQQIGIENMHEDYYARNFLKNLRYGRT